MSTQIDTEHFRARLEDEQRKVRNAIEYLQKENPAVPEEITGDLAMGPGDNHLADLATETVDREIDYTLEENSGNVLREIEAALMRIDDGAKLFEEEAERIAHMLRSGVPVDGELFGKRGKPRDVGMNDRGAVDLLKRSWKPIRFSSQPPTYVRRHIRLQGVRRLLARCLIAHRHSESIPVVLH